MDIAVDLHIHSALSPCAADDMTPNNIVNMALLKNLDVISITDHNSCDNVESIVKVADSRILVLPGMEVQTKEEVHLLCYFENVDKLLDFGRLIDSKLPNIANAPEIFGNQFILDEEDHIIGKKKQMLISSVNLSIEQVLDAVSDMEGVIIPAHIDRSSYSIISQLGFIPENLESGMLEVSKKDSEFSKIYPQGKILYSSDAHNLWQILERESFLSVDNISLLDVLYRLGYNP